jgi:ribose transport system permease protein
MENTIVNRSNIKKLDFSSIGLLMILAIIIIIFSILSPIFYKLTNIITILLSISVLGIATTAQNIVVISGGIDLSQEAVIATSAIVLAFLNKLNLPLGISISGGIFAGIIIGLINGILITKVKINPLIVTLATLGLTRGFAILLSKGLAIGIYRKDFSFLAKGFTVYGISFPLCVIILIAIFLIVHFILSCTLFGRRVYAIGGNPQATIFAGVNVDRTYIVIYIISSTFAAFSGIIFASIAVMANAFVANGYNINILAAVFLGGTAYGGGRGKIIGTILGVMIIGVLNNGLQLLGLSTNINQIIIGVALLISVFISQIRTKKQ